MNGSITEQKSLETCQSQLFPVVPPTPKPAPLASFAGTYFDAGYGNLTLSLICNSSAFTAGPNSPAHPTVENGCFLRSDPRPTAAGFAAVELQHIFSNYWIGWGYSPSYLDYHHPILCTAVQSKVSESGQVTDIGVILSSDAPKLGFAWFKRVV